MKSCLPPCRDSGVHAGCSAVGSDGAGHVRQATVRDLYLKSDLGNFTDFFTGRVPVHGVLALRITPLKCAMCGTSAVLYACTWDRVSCWWPTCRIGTALE